MPAACQANKSTTPDAAAARDSDAVLHERIRTPESDIPGHHARDRDVCRREDGIVAPPDSRRLSPRCEPAAGPRRGDREAEALAGLPGPVIKGVLTDRGIDSTGFAYQVRGGHIHFAENGMRQCIRDARLAMILQGARGMLARDLVGGN